jgi:Kelch motif
MFTWQKEQLVKWCSMLVAFQTVPHQVLQAHCCLQVFVLGGSWSGPKDLAKDAEVYDPTLGTWSSLPGIQAAYILTDDPEDELEGFSYRGDNYGMFHPWSEGTGKLNNFQFELLSAACCTHSNATVHALNLLSSDIFFTLHTPQPTISVAIR